MTILPSKPSILAGELRKTSQSLVYKNADPIVPSREVTDNRIGFFILLDSPGLFEISANASSLD